MHVVQCSITNPINTTKSEKIIRVSNKTQIVEKQLDLFLLMVN